jgi:hypothetical protein
MPCTQKQQQRPRSACLNTTSGGPRDKFGRPTRPPRCNRMRRPMVVQRPPKVAPITIERYCTERRPWINPSGLWHPFSTSCTVLPPRGDGNYHRVCAAIQTAVRALRCQRRIPRSHPSPEAAHQAENAAMQAIFRAWKVAPRWTMVMRSSRRELDQRLWPTLKCVSLRVVSPHSGERCPGVRSVGGRSGGGHLRSLMVAPLRATSKTPGGRW